MKNRSLFFAGILLLNFLMLSCSNTENKKEKETATTTEKSENNKGEEIKSSPLKVDSEFRKNLTSQTVVEGTIHNNTSSKFSKVKLKVKFLNKNGKVLKSDMIAIDGNVAPGDTPYKNKFNYWDAGFSKVSVEVSSAKKIN